MPNSHSWPESPLISPARGYPARGKANLLSQAGRLQTTDDPGGVGSETVREILVCPNCAKEPAGHSSEDCGPSALAFVAG